MKTRVFLTSVAIIATFIAPNITLADPAKQKTTDTGEQQQSPAKTVASQKYVDDTKQAKIPATSDGTNNTPNYVYDSTNNTTADGSVVTTGATDGTISQRGIANAPTRNNNGDLTNREWIPNMNAVDNMITDTTRPIQLDVNDINNRIINGMPFKGSKYPYQFAGEEDITNVVATTTVRNVTIPAIDGDDISDWTVIVVQPGVTADATGAPGTFNGNALLLKINGAKSGSPILYKYRTVTDATAPIVWNASYPSIFVFSRKVGKNGAWLFAGSGDDLPTHKVNGAPLSNLESYYYGSGTASVNYMAVTIPSIPSVEQTLPEAGQIIAVQPTNVLGNYNCITSEWTLKLNDFDQAPVLYANAPLDCDPANDNDAKDIVWNNKIPSMFVFDGTNWVFLGHGLDKDTTYGTMTVTTGRAGTNTDSATVTAKNLKATVHGLTLSTVSGTDARALSLNTNQTTAIGTDDTIIGAFGKAQGQINNRQTLIPATSNGANNTPNYVYNQSTNSTADGSVVTTTGTAGTVSQRGIATAPVYVTENNVTTLDNASWIPTMGAVMNAVSGATSNTVNGASLSNEASYFYGTSSTAATAEIKDVSIPGIATPGTNDRTIIVVQPEHTSANTGLSGIKLRLNSDAAADAKPIYVNGAATDIQTQSLAWNENYPSTFVYDGTKWVFLGAGYNIDAVISSYKVNGVSLSKNGGYFYAQSNVAGNLCAKTALFQTTDFNWTLNRGQVVVIKPLHTSTCNDAHTLSLNSTTAAPIYYNGATVSDATTGAKVWAEGIPSIFVYDGTNWVFAGNSIDNDTTYPSMSVSEGTTGTATTESSLTAANLKQIVQGTTLTGLSTSSTALLTEADSITTAIGKLEGQKQIKIPATSNGTNSTPNYVYDATNNSTADGSVITTTGTAGMVSQRGIATAPVYVTENNVTTLDNASWIPTMGAVMNAIDTRQKKKVCAGYEPAEAGQPAHDGTHPGDEDYCWLWIFPD